MKTLMVLLAFLLPPAVAIAQAADILGPADAIGFDYLDAEFTTAQVTRFEAQWDAGPWVTISIPPTVVLSTTTTGAKTYKVIPSFTNATHTVAFRACNVIGCGAASSVFPFVVGVAPNQTPTGVRKIAR